MRTQSPKQGNVARGKQARQDKGPRTTESRRHAPAAGPQDGSSGRFRKALPFSTPAGSRLRREH